MSATATNLTRIFRFNGLDLPDPDPSYTPDQVLSHYARQHPTLNHGSVEDVGAEGDQYVFTMKPSEFKANG